MYKFTYVFSLFIGMLLYVLVHYTFTREQYGFGSTSILFIDEIGRVVRYKESSFTKTNTNLKTVCMNSTGIIKLKN